MEEKQFLNEVLEELKQYQISSKNRKDIKQQLLEHIQESHEHGQDSINELGDTTTFVKDFLEINGIDLLSETNNQIFYEPTVEGDTYCACTICITFYFL